MVELVDRLVKDGRLRSRTPVPMRVTYHDPCQLGRQGEPYVPWNGKEKKIFGQAVVYDPPRPRYNGAFGVYEPPRDVLRAIPGVELVEMERIPGSRLVLRRRRRAARRTRSSRWTTAASRIEEAEATGADALVSACPWCERNFSRGDREPRLEAEGPRRRGLVWPSDSGDLEEENDMEIPRRRLPSHRGHRRHGQRHRRSGLPRLLRLPVAGGAGAPEPQPLHAAALGGGDARHAPRRCRRSRRSATSTRSRSSRSRPAGITGPRRSRTTSPRCSSTCAA